MFPQAQNHANRDRNAQDDLRAAADCPSSRSSDDIC